MRNFEAMDQIYQRVRNRTNDGLTKLEPLMKKQAYPLYYEKKPNLYTLMKEKKKQDELDIEKFYQKNQVPVNAIKKE